MIQLFDDYTRITTKARYRATKENNSKILPKY